jgi:hypothetical protein
MAANAEDNEANIPATEEAAHQALSSDFGPVGQFLRDYMAREKCTLKEALVALRLAKPTLKSYQHSFRCVVRHWCLKAEIQWDAAWDENVPDTWEALIETCRTTFESEVRNAPSLQ